jgi:HK97 family phage major capsid protein
MTPKELFQRKGEIVAQMQGLLSKAQAAGRDLTSDESTSYDAMEAQLNTITKTIAREQSLATAEASVAGFRDSRYRPGVNAGRDDSEFRASADYRDAFINGFCRHGRAALTPEHTNALQEGTDSEGGYLVPQEFERAVYASLGLLDPIRAAATVIQTASERNIPIETGVGSFSYINEEGEYGEDDPAFGHEVLKAWKFGGIIKVAEELLQDAGFSLESYLQGLGANRQAMLEGVSFSVGNGTSQPLGLFTAAAVAGVNLGVITGAVSATPAITGDNLIDTFYELPNSYRKQASWLIGDTMISKIRRITTTDGQFLWQPGLAAGQPDQILGRPLLTAEGGPQPAAGAKTIVFGDLKTYVIVDRLGLTMQRLNELYAKNGQIGFKFTGRHDARLTDPKAIVQFKHGAAS